MSRVLVFITVSVSVEVQCGDDLATSFYEIMGIISCVKGMARRYRKQHFICVGLAFRSGYWAGLPKAKTAILYVD